MTVASVPAARRPATGAVAAWGLLAAGALLYAALPSPWRAFGLAAFAGGAYLSPRAALLVALAVVPASFEPPTIGPYRFAPHTLAIGLTTLAMVARWVVGRAAGLALRRDPSFAGAVAAFVAAGFLSMAATIAPAESARALREVVLVPVLYFVLTMLAFGRGDAEREWDRDAAGLAGGVAGAGAIATALVAAGTVAAGIGLAQYALGVNLIEAEGTYRIRALYGSPNNLALLLGRAIPLAAALALAGARPRWPMLAALGVMLAALGLTFSVGGWLGAAAGLLVVALLAHRRGPWLLLGGLGAAAVAALPLLRLERVASHLSFTDSTTFFRVKIWESALAMLRDHPVLGIGLDAFLAHYDPARGGRYMRPEAWQESTISHPHNLLLDAWLSLGLVGLAATLVLLWVLARDIGRARRASSDAARAVGVGAAGLTTDFLVHGAIDNSYFLPDLAVVFWAVMTMLRLNLDAPGGDPSGPRPAPARPGNRSGGPLTP